MTSDTDSIKKNLLKTIPSLFAHLGIGEAPNKYLEELESDKAFLEEIEEKVSRVPEFRTKHFENIHHIGRAYKTMQYILIRAIKPKIAVETGVLHGLSSSFILRAISKNESGKLISIDKPASVDWKDRPVSESGRVDDDDLPKNNQSGWAVPDRLRQNWQLKLGASSDILPGLFEEIKCDYFVHDSEHTYKNMLFELEIAWKNLNPGGIIVCDNVDWCKAFHDFCKQNNIDNALLISDDGKVSSDTFRFGIVRKQLFL